MARYYLGKEAAKQYQEMTKAGVKLSRGNFWLLFRLSKKHQRLMTKDCNGEISGPTRDSFKLAVARTRRRILTIANDTGINIAFEGDPRGFTVYLRGINGLYNTWGGQEHGYGIG